MRNPGLLLAGMTLLSALACGGRGSTAPAGHTLVYTNPAANPSDWQLVADVQASTPPSHLVLDLMAPAGTSGQGVTLTLTTDGSQANWTLLDGNPSTPFLQSAYPSPLVAHASVQGSVLRLVTAQAPGTPVAYGSAPVVQVALDVAAGAVAGNVSLEATDGGHLGARVPPVVIGKVDVGSLRVQ